MEHRLANSLASALIGLTLATISLAHAQIAQPQVPFKVPAFAAGKTDFDVADRLALTNLISAYSIQVDTFNLDAWFDLFTADAVFVAREAGRPQVELGGDKFREFTRERFTAFGKTGNDRRHLISTILFVEQTKDTAHAVMFGLLTNVKDAKTFTAVTNLNYEGWFVKTNGVWKITRWVDAPSSSPGK
ncbi:MAG: nuclear transport factor 2 family protein [Burkholderiales bacterium]